MKAKTLRRYASENRPIVGRTVRAGSRVGVAIATADEADEKQMRRYRHFEGEADVPEGRVLVLFERWSEDGRERRPHYRTFRADRLRVLD